MTRASQRANTDPVSRMGFITSTKGNPDRQSYLKFWKGRIALRPLVADSKARPLPVIEEELALANLLARNRRQQRQPSLPRLLEASSQNATAVERLQTDLGLPLLATHSKEGHFHRFVGAPPGALARYRSSKAQDQQQLSFRGEKSSDSWRKFSRFFEPRKPEGDRSARLRLLGLDRIFPLGIQACDKSRKPCHRNPAPSSSRGHRKMIWRWSLFQLSRGKDLLQISFGLHHVLTRSQLPSLGQSGECGCRPERRALRMPAPPPPRRSCAPLPAKSPALARSTAQWPPNFSIKIVESPLIAFAFLGARPQDLMAS